MIIILLLLILIVLFQGWSIRRLLPLAGYVTFRYFLRGQRNLYLHKLKLKREAKERYKVASPTGVYTPATCEKCYCMGCKNNCTTCRGCNDKAARLCMGDGGLC
jgi:hypothetical protein